MRLVFVFSLFIVGALCQVTCPTFNGKEYADIPGRCNNQQNPHWGSAGHTLLRTNINGNPPYKGGVAAYADGIGQLIKRDRPSVVSTRDLSNFIHNQPDINRICSGNPISDFNTFFGQAVNHDMNKSPAGKGINNGVSSAPEPAPIALPENDPYFVNYVSAVPFTRTDVVIGTGVSTQREQFNSLTSYLDLSIVYSFDQAANDLLREYNGGRLLLDQNGEQLLPTVDYVCNFQAARLGQDPDVFVPVCTARLGISTPHPFSTDNTQTFAAGDNRVNENFGLLALHTLFALNHNYYANLLQAQNPGATDEELFYRARAWNIAEYQRIIYRDYVEITFGSFAPDPYTGYDETVDASSNNEMVTGIFRFGHSQISATILRRYANGTGNIGGDVFIRDQYFQPYRFKQHGGLNTVLHGMSFQRAEPVDVGMVDALRNFLFGPGDPSLGMDLIAINIQRARDHGILAFNDVRRAFGLTPYTNFQQITKNAKVARRLEAVYASVEDCDLFVCAMAEKPYVPRGLVGETIAIVMKDQFERVRDGDRFYFENQCGGNGYFTEAECEQIRAVKIEDIIARFEERPRFNPFYVNPKAPNPCVKAKVFFALDGRNPQPLGL